VSALAAQSEIERFAWLRLARTIGVGPVTFFGLISRCGSAIAALDALPELAKRAGRKSNFRVPDTASIDEELDRLSALGACLLTPLDPLYPQALAAVSPPPPVIAVQGNAALLARPCIGIVGARNASAAGLKMARNLGADLGKAGWVVVSGLARGIDGAAHQASLPTGTIAVLAGGLDFIYPPEHESLHRQIATRGALVSENALGAPVHAKDFPRRNRIVSGISLGVVVVEAEERSGSLITARTASEQGREVFAVPGSPLDPRARGTNGLIRLGATLTESAADILAVLDNLKERTLREPEPFEMPIYEPAIGEPNLRDRLQSLLSPTPVSLDDLAEWTGAPIGLVAGLVVDLELSGQAISLAGGFVVRGE